VIESTNPLTPQERAENWETGREKRINNWRDFNKKSTKKRKLKAPAIRAEDEHHSYVRRPPQRKNAF
jgi:hypothetical protein